jgi:hypothetical protein
MMSGLLQDQVAVDHQGEQLAEREGEIHVALLCVIRCGGLRRLTSAAACSVKRAMWPLGEFLVRGAPVVEQWCGGSRPRQVGTRRIPDSTQRRQRREIGRYDLVSLIRGNMRPDAR